MPHIGDKLIEAQQRRASLLNEMDQLNLRAEAEHREFTPDEQSRWDSTMSTNGLVEQLDKEIANMQNTIAGQKRLAAARFANEQPAPPYGYSNDGLLPAVSTANRSKCFKSMADAMAAGQFLRQVATGQILATATEGTPSAGGYTVPDPLSAAIIDVRNSVSVSRKTAKIVPMTADTLRIAKVASGATVYYPGEAGAITPSDAAWEQLLLTAVKRGCYSKVTNELLADNIVGLADWVVQDMGHALAAKEDAEYVNGDGTSAYGGESGLLDAIGSAGVVAAASGHDTWAELTMSDFAACMAKLPSKYMKGASWLCSANFYFGTMLRAMADAGGNSMVSLAQGVDEGLFLGKPVYFTDEMPTATAVSTVSCLFGNFAEAAIIGDRQGFQIGMSRDRHFDEDLTAFRAISRYDILVHEAGDSSNPGAYVGLKTAAS